MGKCPEELDVALGGAVVDELALRYRGVHRHHQARNRHHDARSPPTAGLKPRLNQPLESAVLLRPLQEPVDGDGEDGGDSDGDVTDELKDPVNKVLLTLHLQYRTSA